MVVAVAVVAAVIVVVVVVDGITALGLPGAAGH